MNETIIEANLKTGETVTTRNGIQYNGMAGFIKSQLDMLIGFQKQCCSDTPELLKQDIRVYLYILGGEKPEELAEQYFQKKREYEKRGIYCPEKSQIADDLGWDWNK